MQKRRLGRSDLFVTPICLGTMTYGEQTGRDEAFAILDRAVAFGIDFLDAAEMYPVPPKRETQGATETIIGDWLAGRGRRNDIVLATKVCGRSASDWFRDDGSPTRLTRSQIFEAVEKSLRRLRVDHIDLYQIHWPDRVVSEWGTVPSRFKPFTPAMDETAIEETAAAFAELIAAGKIRHFGLSNESPYGLMRFIVAAERGIGPRPVSVQNAYSLVNRTWEGGLAEIALREEIGLLPYSPLAQGYLTGKYRNGALPENSRKALFNRLQRYEKPHADAAIGAYVDIAHRFGADPVTFAIAFAMNQPTVASVIIGPSAEQQLKSNLAAAEFAWTKDMQAAVDDLHQRFGNPCP
ncbi:aldo/keto reductase [Pleomorphomonas diazotrophica]|uniref:Aldo/keto reductase n=1 Tax=Pleomorphomonas diazotrophica TaxID=1166257 RepID=A0A1I4RVX8_9HYPH|nr:aldo/keto reductase [Pleomorphomonas diazotrophica]PKR88025.1 aldo/keto reductase [Pleomorphomonas diazotrophica]SFM56170.1 Predicted oxidoreductase [Pleomorphomonas diazotrophica]